MNRTVLTNMLLVSVLGSIPTSLAMAVAPMESEIDGIEVIYRSGNSIKLDCKSGNCLVQINIGSNCVRFDQDDLYWQVVPKSPILFTGTGGGIDFSFQLQVVCPKRLISARGECFANYSVSDGNVKDRVIFFIPRGAAKGLE